MSTLQEIESAIDRLPPRQRRALLQRLQDRHWGQWDRQIASDQKAGRLDAVVAEVEAEIATGKVKPLHELIGDR
jgi:uncharacterized membrane protein